MPVNDPGAGGDPYVTRLDGENHYFGGIPYARYRLAEHPSVTVLGRVIPVDPDDASRTYFGGVDIHARGEVHVYVGTDGMLHVAVDGVRVCVKQKIDTIDAIGHPECTTEDPHPLHNVPHLNVSIPGRPEGDDAMTGLVKDWAEGGNPDDYFVPG